MEYCQECGSKLEKSTRYIPEDSWEYYQDCMKCNISYRTICGDYMGGSSDDTQILPKNYVQKKKQRG